MPPVTQLGLDYLSFRGEIRAINRRIRTQRMPIIGLTDRDDLTCTDIDHMVGEYGSCRPSISPGFYRFKLDELWGIGSSPYEAYRDAIQSLRQGENSMPIHRAVEDLTVEMINNKLGEGVCRLQIAGHYLIQNSEARVYGTTPYHAYVAYAGLNHLSADEIRQAVQADFSESARIRSEPVEPSTTFNGMIYREAPIRQSVQEEPVETPSLMEIARQSIRDRAGQVETRLIEAHNEAVRVRNGRNPMRPEIVTDESGFTDVAVPPMWADQGCTCVRYHQNTNRYYVSVGTHIGVREHAGGAFDAALEACRQASLTDFQPTLSPTEESPTAALEAMREQEYTQIAERTREYYQTLMYTLGNSWSRSLMECESTHPIHPTNEVAATEENNLAIYGGLDRALDNDEPVPMLNLPAGIANAEYHPATQRYHVHIGNYIGVGATFEEAEGHARDLESGNDRLRMPVSTISTMETTAIDPTWEDTRAFRSEQIDECIIPDEYRPQCRQILHYVDRHEYRARVRHAGQDTCGIGNTIEQAYSRAVEHIRLNTPQPDETRNFFRGWRNDWQWHRATTHPPCPYAHVTTDKERKMGIDAVIYLKTPRELSRDSIIKISWKLVTKFGQDRFHASRGTMRAVSRLGSHTDTDGTRVTLQSGERLLQVNLNAKYYSLNNPKGDLTFILDLVRFLEHVLPDAKIYYAGDRGRENKAQRMSPRLQRELWNHYCDLATPYGEPRYLRAGEPISCEWCVEPMIPSRVVPNNAGLTLRCTGCGERAWLKSDNSIERFNSLEQQISKMTSLGITL